MKDDVGGGAQRSESVVKMVSRKTLKLILQHCPMQRRSGRRLLLGGGLIFRLTKNVLNTESGFLMASRVFRGLKSDLMVFEAAA